MIMSKTDREQAEKVSDSLSKLIIEARGMSIPAAAATMEAMAYSVGYAVGTIVPSPVQGPFLADIIKAVTEGIVQGKLDRGDKDQLIIITQELKRP